MENYWAEFLPLMLVFILAVISPGPDFVLIVRQALLYGRRAAFLSAIGIGSALLVHVSYTVLGLGLIIAKSLLLFNIIKWAGIAYLLYLGYKALTSKGGSPSYSPSPVGPHNNQSALQSFIMGFSINLLNPKAVVFFLSIFSTFVALTTPMTIKFSYGLLMSGVAATWFMLLSLFMTTRIVRDLFMRLSKWIDRVSGLIFVALGIRLMFQTPS